MDKKNRRNRLLWPIQTQQTMLLRNFFKPALSLRWNSKSCLSLLCIQRVFSSSSRPVSDWRPQVVRVAKVEHHPTAHSLDVATVLNDFPVVVRRDEYRPGDLAAYIPIDTVLPDKKEYHFMSPPAQETYEEDGKIKTRPGGPKYSVGSVPEKYRIVKAKKLRGVYSQGMLVAAPAGLQESDSVIDALGLKKWEEVEEERASLTLNTEEEEPPPSAFEVPHYDVVGIREFLDCLQEGEEVVLTEKLHGSNCAFVHDGTRLWVKSRNLFKKKNLENMWWDIALRVDLENKLRDAPLMVFFGEIYGQVKGFRYDTSIRLDSPRPLPRVRFFDVWDVAAGTFLSYDDRVRMIEARGLDPVPLLYRGPWLGRDRMYALAEGPSMLGGGKHLREGWVLNTARERAEPRLQGRMQVKLVSEGYNLRK